MTVKNFSILEKDPRFFSSIHSSIIASSIISNVSNPLSLFLSSSVDACQTIINNLSL